jgi:hypothetical protein
MYSRPPTPPPNTVHGPNPPSDPFSYRWRREPYSTVGAVPSSRHHLDPPLWPSRCHQCFFPAAGPSHCAPPKLPLPSQDPASPRLSRGEEAEGEKKRWEAERDELGLAAAGADAPGDGYRGRGSRWGRSSVGRR